MSKIKEYIKLLQSNNVPFEKQQEALQAIEQAIKDAKAKKEEVIGQKADLVVSAFKQIEDKLNKKFDELLQTPAMKGEPGPKGKDGRDGKDGKDGLNGRDGRDGVDGKDGVDGVSVVDARIDFDGSLVITLSDGSEIDAGEVVSSAIAKEVNNFMTRGEILPLQTGNSGKYLKTDGNILSWDTLDGSDINLSSPPAIGNTTPNTGSFTQVRVNQSWDDGTGRLQVTGQAAIEGNAVAQDVIVQGGNNLLLRSQEFQTATAWGTTNASISADATTAPDGTTTADKLVENTANGQHRCLQAATVTASTTYTASFYAKASERTRVVCFDNSNASNTSANFDLSAGTIISEYSAGVASITSVGNGWYRCSVRSTTGAAQTSFTTTIGLVSTGTTNTYTGDGVSGIFIWGAQLELGTVASPYTPTTSAAVTTTNDITVPSGQVQTALGSASLPSYSALGDTNTGMFFPAADTIAFGTGGTETFRADSSGRLLIGLTSAPIRLSVGQSNPARGILQYVLNSASSSRTGAQIQFTQSGLSDWAIGQPANVDAFAFWSGRSPTADGTERMRITSAGDIGIGTNNPSFTVDISRTGSNPTFALTRTDASVAGSLRFEEGNSGAFINQFGSKFLALQTANTERMRIDSSGNVVIGTTSAINSATNRGTITLNGTTSSILTWATGGGEKGYVFHNGTDMQLQQVANGALTFGTNNTERMRITSAGNVGIGTTTPARTLEVLATSSSMVAQFRSGSGNNGFICFSNTNSTADQVRIGSTDGNLVLSTNYTERVRIDSTGNVGIGTASPGAKLDVSGTAQASQLRAATAYTVATLPTASAGMIARVTDGDAALAWGATVVNSGAGATPYLVWYNGTNWTVMGK